MEKSCLPSTVALLSLVKTVRQRWPIVKIIGAKISLLALLRHNSSHQEKAELQFDIRAAWLS